MLSSGLLLLLFWVEVGGAQDVEGAVHIRKHAQAVMISSSVLRELLAGVVHVDHLLLEQLVMDTTGANDESWRCIVGDGDVAGVTVGRCRIRNGSRGVMVMVMVMVMAPGRRGGGQGRPGGTGERVALRRPWVVVLGGVGDDEHGRVGAAALHLLAGGAALGAAAAVVPPRVRRPLDRLLPVLAPRPGVRRRAHGHPLHLLVAHLALLLPTNTGA